MERFLLLWIVAVIIGRCVLGLSIAKICGTSMAATFDDGEYVLIAAVRDCREIQRGDVITFYPDQVSSTPYIKRVVGLPGETIEADNSSVFVNGIEVSFWHGTGTWGPITIPADAVFVLGDNRGMSCDSRTLGCISFSQICAKVIGKSVLLS